MKIASLLPYTTELACLFGLEDDIVAVSHECDFPVSMTRRTQVTSTAINIKDSSPDIHRHVELLGPRDGLYQIDSALLLKLKPDVILTQDQCEACAVSLSGLKKILHAHQELHDVKIFTVNPKSVGDIFQDIIRLGIFLGLEDKAKQEIATLQRRWDLLMTQSAGQKPIRLACIEWTEPPMIAGNWIPEIVRAAGAQSICIEDDAPSRVFDWNFIFSADPDAFLLMPCGFGLQRSLEECNLLFENPEWSRSFFKRQRRLWYCDANSFFTRPGPRLIDSAEALRLALHPVDGEMADTAILREFSFQK